MSTAKIEKEEREESLLSTLLFRFAPYWPLFVLLAVVFGAAAWTYLKFATPLYDATATILLKDEKKGVDDGKMLNVLDMYTSNKIVENEIEVIQSRTLMQEVVGELQLYAPVYVQRRFADSLAYLSSPVIITAKNPDQLTATADPVPFKYNHAKASITVDSTIYPLNTWVNTPYGVLKFSERPGAATSALPDYYFRLSNPKSVAGAMVSRLDIQPVSKASTVLYLDYRDESPNRAQDILNSLIGAYARSAIKEKNSLAANTLQFIEGRLRLVVKDLDSIERTIQEYKTRNGIVDLSEQGKQFLQNVGDNDRQLSDIDTKLAVLNQVEQYVVSKNNASGIVPATLDLNDEVLSRQLQRLYEAETEYSKMKGTMAENSPSLTAVVAEIESIRPTILENVRNQRSSLEASRKNVAATSGLYTSMLKTIPQKERELLEISRQQSIKNNVYSFLLQKREETALSASSTVADSRLIDPAQASLNPVSPKRMPVLLGALVVAFALSIGIVVAKELLSRKILFRSDIEAYTQVPIVGEIVSVKHKGELVVNSADKTFVAEQFRQLRAAIGLYGRIAAKKKILITSSIPGEGKSFVAANLAVSLALSGKKVVLIDADLRNPKTTSIFEMENEAGLAEYLEGKESIEKLLKRSTITNLAVIPAGTVSNNPTELLLNGDLNELFAYLENGFDYVLVDTSPVDPVTDAYVLSQYCDRTLFVIRHAYTPKAMVQLLDESNKIKALRNLAIVFNGIKKRGFLKGSYGFGYGFGYEYVYKETVNKKKAKQARML